MIQAAPAANHQNGKELVLECIVKGCRNVVPRSSAEPQWQGKGFCSHRCYSLADTLRKKKPKTKKVKNKSLRTAMVIKSAAFSYSVASRKRIWRFWKPSRPGCWPRSLRPGVESSQRQEGEPMNELARRDEAPPGRG